MCYAVIMMVLMIIFPKDTLNGAINGLRLCASAVIPSLFPFFIVTRVITANIAKLRIFETKKKYLFPLIISFLGGYPVGAATVSSMYENGKLDKREAEQALTFCNNSGPGFFIGMIGTITLGSVKEGLMLYFVHVCAALLCAHIFKTTSGSYTMRRIKQPQTAFAQIFSNALTASSEAIIQVSATVIFFSVLSELLHATQILRFFPADAEALICGILELTSGIAKLKGSANAFVLCAFFMGWGGFCVHMQAMCLWQKVGLKPKFYFVSKLLHGLLSALFALTLLSKSVILLLSTVVVLIFCIFFPQIRQNGVEKREKLLYNKGTR